MGDGNPPVFSGGEVPVVPNDNALYKKGDKQEDTQTSAVRSAIKSLGHAATTSKKSLANSIVNGTNTTICTCPNCTPPQFCSLRMVVFLLALPCILHFYYYYYAHDPSGQRDETTSDSRKVILTLGFLGLLISVQLLLSLFAVPSDAELHEWEQKAREYAVMLLMGGTLFGFLISVAIVRTVLIGSICNYCGRERD